MVMKREFKTGDKVVVIVPGDKTFHQKPGTVVQVNEVDPYFCKVLIPDYDPEWPVLFDADELEHEDVYKVLSHEPAEAVSDLFFAPEVETRLEEVVEHPKHYTSHPSGVECIDITKHMGFLDGNAMKYLWRYSMKNGIEDLYKLRQYVDWLIETEEGKNANS